MFNPFRKSKNDTVTVYAPVSGKLIAIGDVKDPVFSAKMLGDGCAIEPMENDIVSPVDGEIAMIFDTLHGVGMKAGGAELLIHCGIDTVELKGEGFEARNTAGSTVRHGAPLLSMDIKAIAAKGYDTVIPIVVTNSADLGTIEHMAPGPVKAGDPVMVIHKK